MFQLTETYKFWWPVIVKMPGDQPGSIVEQPFEAQFVALRGDAVAERDKAIAEFAQEPGVTATDIEFRVLSSVVLGWRDVVDGDGTSVPFSLDALRHAASITWIRDALFRAYAEALAGKALEKNFVTPPVPGPSPAPVA